MAKVGQIVAKLALNVYSIGRMAFGKKKRGKSQVEEDTQENCEEFEREADFSQLDREDREPEAGSAQSSPASSAELEAALREAGDFKDKYLRALAEFENYKKHTLKERSELLKYQGERIFVDLLEVLDNLELALLHAQADPAKLRSGLELIHKQFVDVLSKWEVRAESAVGKQFDPARHSAISRAEVDHASPGSVISELKKPYLYKDKLLRFGEVVVAAEQNPQAVQGESSADEAVGSED